MNFYKLTKLMEQNPITPITPVAPMATTNIAASRTSTVQPSAGSNPPKTAADVANARNQAIVKKQTDEKIKRTFLDLQKLLNIK